MGKAIRTMIQTLPGLILVMFAVTGTIVLAGVPEEPPAPLAAGLLYPSVQTLSLRELGAVFDDALVVDVRTRFEFDTVHINGSVNQPLAGDDGRDTDTDMQALSRGKSLVFTGNDALDTRPFKAALAATLGGLSPVRVLALGVLAWTDAFPDRATLMGSSPAVPGEILPDAVHRQHLLDPKDFMEAIPRPDALVIDIRNAHDRTQVPLNAPLHPIPMEAFLEAVGCRVWSEKTLFILDSDNTRLAWLHRFLQAGGYDDVLFLNGGARTLGKDFPETGGKDQQSISVDQDRLHRLLSDAVLSGAQKQFMILALTRITRENSAVMPLRDSAEAMGCSVTDLVAMADVLQTSGLVRYASSGDILVFRVDPGLAWKGVMKGKAWDEQVRIFRETAEPWRAP
ncbi:MAG: rhodanese-like domain-containing protein [Pseudomonadota bacterium]